MVALTEKTMEMMRRRRAAGERLTKLAAEVGVPWQRLDKALRHSTPTTTTTTTVVTRHEEKSESVGPIILTPAGDGTLTERYRPRTLAALVGQDVAVRRLTRIVESPRPMALLFEGETGTGKTSAAIALAADLGCATEHAELGGLHVIASGEQSADAVRECYARMANRPFYGSGWKVLVVNEADRMHAQAETVWLDRLENIPAHTIVVFTTNHAVKLSQRFRDRCTRIRFISSADSVRSGARALLRGIFHRETGAVLSDALLEALITSSTENGHLSFRRAVNYLADHLLEIESSTPSR